ncbi:MAG TPA: methyltransferase domain-containing protein [Chitinophagales bacterium]|nr:methyltransferase domain-containing protein [Chitinophagales bacterium]
MSLKEPQKQEWFETWFDTPYYHILYDHRDDKEAEQFLNALLNHLQLPPESTVLDAACGNGRYSIFLANKGFNVVGIDLSWKNIQHAGNFESENLTFYLHDMREMFYVNYFDAVFNFFTSFGYFSSEKDNLKAIRSLSNSLKPGGRLVIDFFNSEKIVREIIPLQDFDKNNIQFTIKKSLELNRDESAPRVMVKKIFVRDHGKQFEFEERVQALTLKNFEHYFNMHHLKLREVFGDYHLHPFDPQNSERMILVAEKIL